MTFPKSVVDRYPKLFEEWSILTAYRGSIAHGMYVPSSDPTSIDDKDFIVISIPDQDYYYGLKTFGSEGTQEVKQDEWDIVAYEARKFVRLLLQGNPNVLSALWLDPKFYIFKTEAADMLIQNRVLFSGRHVYYSFVGYARGQLHKMTHGAFAGHMGTKRKQIVEKFGFDIKNAAHTIRLLRMGIEFLQSGELQVYRQDAAQLLEVKRGEWSLEKVHEEADHLFKSAEQAYSASTLPDGPNSEEAEKLLVKIVSDTLSGRGKVV